MKGPHQTKNATDSKSLLLQCNSKIATAKQFAAVKDLRALFFQGEVAANQCGW